MGKSQLNNKFLKVFAFYGEDITQHGIKFLQEMHQKGYTILALDVPAVGSATKARIAFTFVDDWLDNEVLQKVNDQAVYCRKNWFTDAYDEFCIDDICWPEFDHEAMYWFWFEIFLAEALAHEFLKRGLDSLAIVQDDVRYPMIYYSTPTDVGKKIIVSILKDKVIIYPILLKTKNPAKFWNLKKAFSVFTYIFGRVKSLMKNYKVLHNDIDIITNKLLIAINPGEVYRFSPIVEDLVIKNKMDCAAAVLTTNQSEANDTSKKWKIPTIIGSSEKNLPQDIKYTLLKALGLAKKKAKGQLWERTLDVLDYHFEYYCVNRWPRLIMDYRLWCKILSESPPKAIIVSSLLDAESHLPTAAAKQFNIPTFSIPHGGVARVDKPIQDFVLYGLSTQRMAYEIIGVAPSRLLPCKDIVFQNEYATQKNVFIDEKRKINILVLTSSIGFPGLITFVGVRGQVNGLIMLKNIPPDLSEKINISIKVHPNPNFSNLELIQAAGINVKENVLPLDSDLPTILDNFDLVIMLNNWSTPVLHALKAGKPVILLNTTFPYIEQKLDFILPSGKSVNNFEELWNCIMQFINDPNYSHEMLQISKKFNMKYLENSAYPDISDVICSKLVKNQNMS